MTMTKRVLIGRSFGFACGAALLMLSSGCVVGQPRGHGKARHFTEPQTKTQYWLYLPDDYMANNGQRPDGRKWPLVMTFHGMKPFDSYTAQIEEWQEEADRYGFIVCAPTMSHASVLDAYPIESETEPFKKDADNILAVMNEVFHKTEADPTRVLSTGWSEGGYMAHYIVNRHPEMFSVLIVKQCNFSAEVMNASRARRYTDMPVGIYYTENDFGICRRESAEAVTWYKQLGFKNLTSGVIDRYGHERMPEVAADLFAKYIGAPPKTPPKRLVRIQTQDMPGQHVASANSRPPGVGPEAFASPPQTTRNRPDNVNYNEIKPAAAERTVQRPPASRPPRPRIATPPPPRRQTNTRTVEPNHLNDQRVASAPQRNNYNPPPNQRTTAVQPPRVQRPVPPPPQRQVQPARATQNPRIAQSNPPVTRSYPKNPPPTAARRNEPPRTQPPANVMAQRNAARRNVPPPTRTPGPAGTVGIDLSSTIGLSPLMVGYSVNLPRDQLRGADILWTDNGEPFSQSPSGQRLLTKAGDHEIGVLVVTSKGMELRQTKKVTVYPREQVSGGLAQR